MTPIEAIAQLKERISQDIIGQERIVERLIIALLANGNILVEGLPGLAKTRAVKSMARNLEAEFSRIQFTPDLLPADITGSDVLVGQSGEPEFRFEAGPIFANIVLADEINRAPAKVQAALLEAMEERQVTVSLRHQPQDATPVHGHGHPEPHRAGGHLSPARGPDGPLSAPCLYRLPG
jgi:MoxR-like ATPase